MNYKAPRGTHDIFGINASGMSWLEQKAKVIFKRHGFEEVRTPVFEDAALFMRSIGQTTDIVEKEMYIFEDRKKRKLALRPEGTASLVRAFIEHRMDVSMPAGRFFYMGEMFRYERPQAGRYRQFHQIGAEFFGSSSPAADAEIIILAQHLLSSVGINEMNIYINSLGCEKCRPFFRETLVKYLGSVRDLCEDCLRRLEKNPLRILDCKTDSNKFTAVPRMSDYLCNCCKDNFNLTQSLLKSVGYNYTVDERLVRGLDYYTKTVFEIRSDAVGSQCALAAGGRYDNLVGELGGQDTPAVGFALGSERVLLAVQKTGFFGSFQESEKIFIAVADQELFSEAFSFAVKAMRNGLKGNKNISVFGPINGKSLTSQLKFADKIKAVKTIVFARTEFEYGKFLMKNMKDKTQTEFLISEF
ncbi:histidine--tRNA ligase [Endomicrobiia bacterium]|uniref:histidine--tRNA ligase n=1 Tax=Endomicrobium trichonymphae TaxID=1408204 RepID=UPI002219D38D|nr:histidine--tRNA ligase [Endomicrobiia bacterium]GMO54951.1 MAG: histidine--tRNA ligase [Candidatus Endomicrobium trichonymphae]GHT08054.1 histidine--tRNA ligase [Endomicrobiia bacterium]GHT13834.1 histidine--tRNA ligase [Endomicrobiia bacterium]GHT19200.1 histidine--tRNA ligase [Endomicrobiia bacterium]